MEWNTKSAKWYIGWCFRFGLIDEFYDAPIRGIYLGLFYIYRQGF